MADNKIDLTATFDTTQASKSVSNFGKEAEKSLDGINSKVDSVQKNIDSTSRKKFNIDTNSATNSLLSLSKTIIGLGAAYASIGAIKNFMSESITASITQQNAINQLNQALARTGQLTKERSQDFQDFASALQQVSTIGDEVALEMLSIARNFTQTDEQAKKLVKTAADMSAAMGISLEAAVRQLGKTFGGMKGELGEVMPEIKALTAEQLKAGAAIDVLANKFAGAATGQINTFEGALTQLKNTFGDFQESIGNIIIQNPVIIQSMKELSNAFFGMTNSVNDSTNSSISFVNRGILALISGIRDLIPSLNSIASFMKSIGFLFDALLKGIMSFVDGLRILGNAWLWLVGTMEGKKSALQGIDDAMDRMAKRGDELADSLMNIGKDAFTSIDLKSFDNALSRIQDAANKKPITIDTKLGATKLPDLSKAIEIKAPKEEKEELPQLDQLVEAEKKRLQEFESTFQPFSDWLDGIQSSWENGIANINWEKFFSGNSGDIDDELTWISANIKAIAANFIPNIKAASYLISRGLFEVGHLIMKSIPSLFTAISGLIAAMGEGAEGARKAIPETLAKITTGLGGGIGAIWGTAGSQIGAGIGSIIGEQIKLASQPIEKTTKAIDEFMTEVPNVLKRITENLPTIMNKVFENLPDLLIAIFKALPSIMRASASAMKPLFKEIGKELPSILQVSLEVVWESVAMIFMAIGYGVQGLVVGLKDMLAEKGPEMVMRVGQFFDGIFGIFDDLKKAILSISMNSIGAEVQKGIDKIVAGFRNFFEMFGKFFTNIGERLGSFFEGLFNVDLSSSISNDVSTKLKSFFSNIFNLESAGNFIKKVGDWFGDLFSMDNLKRMVDSLVDGIKNIFSADNLAKMVQGLIDGIKEVFAKLDPSKAISKATGGGGSNTAVTILTGGLNKAFGYATEYATGGIVPRGYPDDSYPALLTSNETVIPASTTPNLFSLIDKLSAGESPAGNNETNNLLRQLIALIASQQTQIDVKIDRDTLAKAIVNLNKDNRRLA